MPNSEEYKTALKQIEELINHLRCHQSASCALAEEEDALLIRLADWKTDLKPHHHEAIAEIGRYYQQFILSDKSI
ncbi:branched-chain amino acid ABC transporter [Neisseria sp. Dent CA1/247]|uniref:branched-chain amino acid ABC transporter n=1 Tax=Neisseria sp. Dent CA1/247 TaxID=2912675 RepID=UPI001FD3A85A|nr:branched-chain amino acid ABC transporter [Neisseria sp. Dent CA1/247]UOO76252.1 branched-chain amino acid ABC transporter [Neisseria sp. Dent CA1/247]